MYMRRVCTTEYMILLFRLPRIFLHPTPASQFAGILKYLEIQLLPPVGSSTLAVKSRAEFPKYHTPHTKLILRCQSTFHYRLISTRVLFLFRQLNPSSIMSADLVLDTCTYGHILGSGKDACLHHHPPGHADLALH